MLNLVFRSSFIVSIAECFVSTEHFYHYLFVISIQKRCKKHLHLLGRISVVVSRTIFWLVLKLSRLLCFKVGAQSQFHSQMLFLENATLPATAFFLHRQVINSSCTINSWDTHNLKRSAGFEAMCLKHGARDSWSPVSSHSINVVCHQHNCFSKTRKEEN